MVSRRARSPDSGRPAASAAAQDGESPTPRLGAPQPLPHGVTIIHLHRAQVARGLHIVPHGHASDARHTALQWDNTRSGPREPFCSSHCCCRCRHHALPTRACPGCARVVWSWGPEPDLSPHGRSVDRLAETCWSRSVQTRSAGHTSFPARPPHVSGGPSRCRVRVAWPGASPGRPGRRSLQARWHPRGSPRPVFGMGICPPQGMPRG